MEKTIHGKFCLVRFTPDRATGEFLNIGVALHYPDAYYFRIQVVSNTRRVKRVFGDAADTSVIDAFMGGFEFSQGDSITVDQPWDPADKNLLERLESQYTHPVCFSEPRVVQISLDKHRRHDPINAQFDRLYSRLVVEENKRASSTGVSQRTLKFWVRQHLRKRLPREDIKESALIRGAHNEVTVDFLIKNGAYHLLQPITFDTGNDAERDATAKVWAYNFADIKKVHPHYMINAVIYPKAGEHGSKVIQTAKSMFEDAGSRVVNYEDVDDIIEEIAPPLL